MPKKLSLGVVGGPVAPRRKSKVISAKVDGVYIEFELVGPKTSSEKACKKWRPSLTRTPPFNMRVLKKHQNSFKSKAHIPLLASTQRKSYKRNIEETFPMS